MYIRCDDCDWSQDDFYHDGYNPASYLAGWNEYLYGDKRDELDKSFTDDSEFLRENGNITTREVLARKYESFARKIRNMKWTTYDDFKRDKDAGIAVCPRCGSSNFDID